MAVPLEDCRVLIVDDNPFTQKSLALVIRRAGCQSIEFAADGAEALAKVERFRPDLILLDVDMPVMDGLTLCRRLRADPAHAELPILFQTALDSDEEQVRCFEAGGSDFISKPIRPGECVARVRHHLEKRKLFNDLARFRQRVENELRHARAMQLSLLPEPKLLADVGGHYGLSIAPHFETSSELGGDFWTVLPVDERRVGFLIVDFAGHGITAAINTFRLHTLIDRIPVPGRTPAGWLALLNEALKEVLPVGQFATAFFGIIDTVADTLTYAGAGAPNPFAGRRGQGDLVRLDSSGLVLGVSRKAQYTDRTVPFPPGAFLFLYSDALVEARAADDGSFGHDGVEALARNAAVARPDAPLHAVLEGFFARIPRPLTDDLTALWISRP
ncbi:sigma-B regulation protein RsbU (phosphoserine phosphatase) [Azospirillum fermentarium]|uniref:PP2C family protein-serine/threonine phosphatase n=1 Tax=Azospirillum fermentarium TaxID=1233114 RepID=UPI00222625B2|nr:fused response regulator/phosphatase [Azospirillum fermentarium]MCW2246265.1 sigma-B regulation protein RsbU (phosphoserine phosphatase) [Azospirillum fermentarium]